MAYGNNQGGNYGGRYQPRSMGGPRNSSPRTQRDPGDTTNGPSLFNNRAGKFLNFNFWNRCATIEIGAVQPGTMMTWEVRRDAQKVSQAITFGDLSDLWDICEEVLESLKNAGTFTSVGIRVGSNQDNIVEINNGSSLGLSPGIYLVLYKNVDQSGRTNNLEYYPFSDVKVLRGYDHSSGSSKDDISKVGEFRKFTRCVKEATKAMTMAQAHSVQVGSKNDRLTQFKALAAITGALGIDMTAELARYQNTNNGQRSGGNGQRNFNGGGYSGGGNRGTFENSGTTNTNDFQRQQQIMSTLDDPVDIALPMGELTNVGMNDFS